MGTLEQPVRRCAPRARYLPRIVFVPSSDNPSCKQAVHSSRQSRSHTHIGHAMETLTTRQRQNRCHTPGASTVCSAPVGLLNASES